MLHGGWDLPTESRLKLRTRNPKPQTQSLGSQNSILSSWPISQAVDFMRRWRPNTPRGCEGAAYVAAACIEVGATTTRKVGLFYFSPPAYAGIHPTFILLGFRANALNSHFPSPPLKLGEGGGGRGEEGEGREGRGEGGEGGG